MVYHQTLNSLFCENLIATSVGVVDNGVEGLIYPLPEDHSSRCPVHGKIYPLLILWFRQPATDL